MLDSGVIRTLGLFVPLAIAAGLWLWRSPSPAERAAALLATLWNVPALLVVHLFATRSGWWQFDAQEGLLLGLPVDLYLGWAVLWGAIPSLAFPSLHLVLVAAIMLSGDLVFMPVASPAIEVGKNWLLGEVLGLGLCLAPAQLLSRWTSQDNHLAPRVVLQALCFAGLLLFVVPAIILEQTGGSWRPLLDRPAWINGLGLQLLALPVIVGLSAVQEFAERGKGTPVPYDPPKRLVTSGVYAYLANPMQVSMSILLAGWGIFLESALLTTAGFVSLAYSAGLASWDEGGQLAERCGAAWAAYRQAVRPWWPRWQPYVQGHEGSSGGAVARLYVAEGCAQCAELGRWVLRHRPIGLVIVAAEDHPNRDLYRLTYEAGDRSYETEGIAAFARAGAPSPGLGVHRLGHAPAISLRLLAAPGRRTGRRAPADPAAVRVGRLTGRG